MVVTITFNQSTEPMEMFLLAAISKGGLKTLYALQQRANLQPGSIRKALDHLERSGLLDRSDVAAKRGRRAMQLTAAGNKFLEEEWRSSLDARREMESILRSVTVAFLMGDIVEAIKFLGRSAYERELHLNSQKLQVADPKKSPIDFHSAMRGVFENRRREMERDVLKEFGERLMVLAKVCDT